MTAQEFLNQIGTLQKRIETNIRRVEQMQELLTKITPSISDMPKSSTPNVHAFEDRICAKVVLEKEIEKDKIRLDKVKMDVIDAIMLVNREEDRKVLYMRYVELMDWKTIIPELGYSESYIYRIHRNAIKHFVIPSKYKESDSVA